MAGGLGNSQLPSKRPGGATPVLPVQSNLFPASQVEICGEEVVNRSYF